MTATTGGAPPHARTAWWTLLVAMVVVAAVGLLAAAAHPTAARLLLVGCGAELGAASAITSIRAIRVEPASLRPVTWGIWAALTALAAIASATTGDWPATVFALVGTLTCATVTIVVLRAGDHTFTTLDAVCLLLAVAGLVAWQTLHNPSWAVGAACAGDLAALTPTIVHAWQKPAEEPTITFVLIAAGGLCTAAAAWGHWTVTALAYPLYVTASTGAVALLTLRRDHSAVAASAAAVIGADP